MADRGIEVQSGQIRDYITGICCISAEHLEIKRNIKGLLPRNHDNVFYLDHISTCKALLH